MTEAEADKRAADGLPIESADEIAYALMKLQRERTVERSDAWFMINRLLRALTEKKS